MKIPPGSGQAPRDAVHAPQPAAISLPTELPKALEKSLDSFSNRWTRSNELLTKSLSNIPAEYRSILDAQVLLQKVHLESELLTRGVDAFASTFRRLQQMGNS